MRRTHVYLCDTVCTYMCVRVLIALRFGHFAAAKIEWNQQ